MHTLTSKFAAFMFLEVYELFYSLRREIKKTLLSKLNYIQISAEFVDSAIQKFCRFQICGLISGHWKCSKGRCNIIAALYAFSKWRCTAVFKTTHLSSKRLSAKRPQPVRFILIIRTGYFSSQITIAHTQQLIGDCTAGMQTARDKHKFHGSSVLLASPWHPR